LLNIFPGKRPFIIGRSTFAGSGKWAGHWGGDNASKWTDMFFSIPQALTFAIFGIPLFGPDTCGFGSNSDEELCNRWMQLSAFFPFYRNHNTLGANSQEPYRWASVAEASRIAMGIRYSLLPYMYTLFWAAHTRGDTVMRALAWEFPNEPALAAADRQFLLGPALLVTPVLNQGATAVNGVFPGGKSRTLWYDWYTHAAIDLPQHGANVSIPAPLGHIPLFVRGGYVLPLQQPGYTTAASRGNPWNLIVALDARGCAAGELYVDDGESLVPNATLTVGFAAGGSALNVTMTGQFVDKNPLANITVLGVGAAGRVVFNGAGVDGAAYNESSKVLSVTGLSELTSGGAWKADWTLSWA
jgi:alpha-glucosidase